MRYTWQLREIMFSDDCSEIVAAHAAPLVTAAATVRGAAIIAGGVVLNNMRDN